MSRERLHVLVVNHVPNLGGSVRSIQCTVGALDPERFEVTVYTPPGYAAETFRERGMRVVHGPVAAFHHSMIQTYRGFRWLVLGREMARLGPHLIRLRRVLLRNRPDVVHLNEGTLLPAAALVNHLGIPLVWHCRVLLGGGRRREMILDAYRRWADVMVANEYSTLRQLRDVPRAVALNNPVELAAFEEMDGTQIRRSLGIEDGTVVVALVGSWNPMESGREFLLAARALAARCDPRVRFVVLGGLRHGRHATRWYGPLARRLGLTPDYSKDFDRLAVDENGRRVVDVVGYRDEGVADLYAAADIVVTGGRAGIGRQVLEAGAASRPVVVLSDHSDPVVEHGSTGLVVPVGDAEALADAVARLAGSPELRDRMGRAARSRAEALFSAGSVAERLGRLYQDVVAAGGAYATARHRSLDPYMEGPN